MPTQAWAWHRAAVCSTQSGSITSSLDEQHAKYGETPPRLAVEVLSPNDTASKLLREITDYPASGVNRVWLVDSEARSVAVYRADSGPYELRGDAELTGEDVLPGFHCKVSEFFFVPGKGAKPEASPP